MILAISQVQTTQPEYIDLQTEATPQGDSNDQQNYDYYPVIEDGVNDGNSGNQGNTGNGGGRRGNRGNGKSRGNGREEVIYYYYYDDPDYYQIKQ